VAQSLAAHGGSPLAATLLGQRITRIAVHPTRQREGLGQALVARAVAQSHGLDYLSVSFGYTPELWRFWQRCGFTLVRLGTHREASSGCYTAMALYPLTRRGTNWFYGSRSVWRAMSSGCGSGGKRYSPADGASSYAYG
jgi:tRNA(Met) cytidine acetyltransferase